MYSKLTHSPLREFLTGAKAVLPLLIGAAPFGLIYGVVASGTGLPPAAAQGMSLSSSPERRSSSPWGSSAVARPWRSCS